MAEEKDKLTEVAETVITTVPQPTIPEEAATPAPTTKRPGFKAHNYDNIRGGMTTESGRFIRR